jgi:hypothetical protein
MATRPSSISTRPLQVARLQRGEAQVRDRRAFPDLVPHLTVEGQRLLHARTRVHLRVGLAAGREWEQRERHPADQVRVRQVPFVAEFATEREALLGQRVRRREFERQRQPVEVDADRRYVARVRRRQREAGASGGRLPHEESYRGDPT